MLAEHLESAGRNPDRERELAARLSPFEATYWIDLAVRAEVEKDYPRAEKYLLEAARVNHGFEPRWNLMNFYFRRGNAEQFAVWAKRALEMNYGDPAPLFRLCWLVVANPTDIEKLLPPRNELRAQYLRYLVDTKRFSYAHPVARKLALEAHTADVPALLDYWDNAIGTDVGAALEVWNTLCRRKLEPFTELAPSEGRIVTNGNFATAASGRGFDWRAPRLEGVFVTFSASGVSFEMTGDEPEDCTLISEIVPLLPGRRYRIGYEYRGAESDTQSGLRWQVAAGAPVPPLGRSDDLPMKRDWATGQLTFAAEASRSATLSLRYKRAPGTVRRQGIVAFRKVTAELVE